MGGVRPDPVRRELSPVESEPKRGSASGLRGLVLPLSVFPVAKMHQTGAQAITSGGAFQSVLMDVATFDNDGIADLANDQFVVKFPGLYAILGLVHFAVAVVGAATQARFAGFLVNGVDIAQAGPLTPSTIYAARVVCHDVVSLSRGGTIKLRAWQDSGANLNTVVTANLQSFLAIAWVGALT